MTRLTLCAITMATACTGCITVDVDEVASRIKPVSESWPTADIRTVELLLYAGDLSIHQGDDDVVTLDGDIKIHGWAGGNHERKLERLKFESRNEGDTLIIELPRRRARYETEIDITVPRDLALNVDMRYGEIDIDLETAQHARVRLNAGDLGLRLPVNSDADINARATIGDVSIQGFDNETGHPRRKGLVGARYSGDMGEGSDNAEIDLKVSAGSINIRATD